MLKVELPPCALIGQQNSTPVTFFVGIDVTIWNEVCFKFLHRFNL